jgi:hypothetical protein
MARAPKMTAMPAFFVLAPLGWRLAAFAELDPGEPVCCAKGAGTTVYSVTVTVWPSWVEVKMCTEVIDWAEVGGGVVDEEETI